MSSTVSRKATLLPSLGLGDLDGGGGLKRLGLLPPKGRWFWMGAAGAIGQPCEVLRCKVAWVGVRLTAVAAELHACKIITQQLWVRVVPVVVGTSSSLVPTWPP